MLQEELWAIMSGEIRVLEFPRAEISEVGNECLFGDGDFSLLAEARSKRNQIWEVGFQVI
jgi:hypothetical protein